MNINRHNYEEFFVLYWDNELTSEQKKLVEVFVQKNEDLQEEFGLFGETRFAPDENISFDQKELLLNEKKYFLNFTNYQEQLLSYIDDELNENEKSEVEKFAGKHPGVQQELTVLLKTKLQPETEIVFPDKSVLYRKEEKIRVIGIFWKRLAVAAILLLMAGLITFRLINNIKKAGQPEIAKAITPEENKQVQNNIGEAIVKQNSSQPPQENTKGKKINKSLFEKLPVENAVAIKNKENKNNLPKEKKSTDKSLIAVNNTITQSEVTNNSEIKKANNDALATADFEKKKNLFDKSTVTNTSSPSLAIYNIQPSDPSVATEKQDKGGLKGLLRKATRVFEHRTNIKTTTDDNKLLVGVFAVSLK